MPQALYPKKWQKARTATRHGIHTDRAPQIKEHLLCRECEAKFEKNGESEVLKWLAPKAKTFPLHERLRVALPRENHTELSRYTADDLGIDAAKFVYFALSVSWRGAVHQWTLPDGTLTTVLNLGPNRETIRTFLLGETAFPHDVTAVIVIICNDPVGRQVWGLPNQSYEQGCENIKFIARGVIFRVLLEPTIWSGPFG
jgi:hypothetical protein